MADRYGKKYSCEAMKRDGLECGLLWTKSSSSSWSISSSWENKYSPEYVVGDVYFQNLKLAKEAKAGVLQKLECVKVLAVKAKELDSIRRQLDDRLAHKTHKDIGRLKRIKKEAEKEFLTRMYACGVGKCTICGAPLMHILNNIAVQDATHRCVSHL